MNKKGLIPILLGLITFFEYGCSAAQFKEVGAQLMEGVEAKLKAELPKIKEAAIAAAEAKLKEAEQKKLVELDEQLAQFSTKDPVTGIESKVTWKTFDSDKDGSLGPTELANVGKFVMAETAKKVATGEMSKEDAGKTGKSVGYSLAALMALWLAGKGVKAARGKNGAAPSAGPPAAGAGP